jgi:hypothetical protein
MQASPPVCLQVAQRLRRGTLEDDEQFNLRTPAMNEVHSLQRTDTAEDKGIAQGVIQCQSQYMGRKKHALWQCLNAAASAKCGGFLGIETEFVDPFRSSRPSRFNLILCKPCLDIFAHAVPSCAKDVKILSVRWSTSGSRRTSVLHLNSMPWPKDQALFHI